MFFEALIKKVINFLKIQSKSIVYLMVGIRFTHSVQVFSKDLKSSIAVNSVNDLSYMV